jgi:serine/threonine protein kinase
MRHPDQFGEYRLIREIGEGGLAVVYLALRGGRPVAVKLLRNEHFNVALKMAAFVREVEVLSRLSHPLILPVLDHGRVNGIPFAASELFPSVTLLAAVENWLRGTGRVPLPAALHLVREILSILAYLHRTTVYENSASGLFHGDISPENLLLGADGSIRLIDFGSAGQNSAADPTTRPQGKIGYLPPEVLSGEGPSTRTDLYALGIVAFLLLFGHKPFEAESRVDLARKVAEEPLPRLPADGLSATKNDEAALRIFFNRALHKEPSYRFADAEAWGAAFGRLRFAQPAARSAPELARWLSPETLERIRALDEEWRSAVAAAPPPRDVTGPRVEPLVDRKNRRKHPRASLKPKELSAEIGIPGERFGMVCEVVELGRGGLLARWEGVVPKVGESHPLSMVLPGTATAVRSRGKLLYEVHRSGKPLAAFEFESLRPDETAALAAFVGSRIARAEEQADPGAVVLDVSFASAADLEAEFARNLRFGGMWVTWSAAVDPGSSVIVRVELPGRLDRPLLTGHAVSCAAVQPGPDGGARYGIGVQLDAAGDDLRRILTPSG